MLRTSADLGLLRYLTKSDKPLTVTQLANLTGASPPLLGIYLLRRPYLLRVLKQLFCPERILRYLAGVDMIKETGVSEYTANSISHVLADPKGEAMIYHG